MLLNLIVFIFLLICIYVALDYGYHLGETDEKNKLREKWEPINNVLSFAFCSEPHFNGQNWAWGKEHYQSTPYYSALIQGEQYLPEEVFNGLKNFSFEHYVGEPKHVKLYSSKESAYKALIQSVSSFVLSSGLDNG